MNAPSDRESTFGRFVLLPARKLLLEDGRPVAVGSRALELLTALVERPGELITREELIELWRGDDVAACAMVDQLIEHSTRYAQSLWVAWGNSYRVVLARHGTRGALSETSAASWNPSGGAKALDMMGTLVDDMAVAKTCARVDAGVVGWCAPEILRSRAETLRRQRSRAADGEVEALLLRSLSLARTQGALAWELRTATSLASLRREQGRPGEALELLAPISSRFVEDLEAADLHAARELIGTLQESLLRQPGGGHG